MTRTVTNIRAKRQVDTPSGQVLAALSSVSTTARARLTSVSTASRTPAGSLRQCIVTWHIAGNGSRSRTAPCSGWSRAGLCGTALTREGRTVCGAKAVSSREAWTPPEVRCRRLPWRSPGGAEPIQRVGEHLVEHGRVDIVNDGLAPRRRSRNRATDTIST